MTFLLAHEVVGDASAPRTAYVLHGALGSGQNFRSFARRLQHETPHVRYVLVDLRCHGRSHPAPPPHTLSACARDVSNLAAHLQASPDCVIGHSFGGKVALELARSANRTPALLWVLDSDPGVQQPGDDHEIRRVIAAVRKVARPIRSRRDVVDAMSSQGMSTMLANWMSTNVRRVGDQYEWNLDLDGIEEMMHDYFSVDSWPYLEQPRDAPRIHLVIAERSDRWTPKMRSRALALPAPGVTTHVLPNAGHWVHVDNPAGLLALIAPTL